MYEYYFADDAEPATDTGGGTAGAPNLGYFDTITANRYNVGGPDAFISGTDDKKGLVVTAGGSNAAIAVAADGSVTIRDLNVTGKINIDGAVTDPDAPVDTGLTLRMGPTINLSWGFEDIAIGNYHMGNREPGEESNYTFFHGLVPQSALQRARLIIRGRALQAAGEGWASMKVVAYNTGGSTNIFDDLQVWVTRTQGYNTTVTPWFTPTPEMWTGWMLRIYVMSLPDTTYSNKYRFGPIYCQFSA